LTITLVNEAKTMFPNEKPKGPLPPHVKWKNKSGRGGGGGKPAASLPNKPFKMRSLSFDTEDILALVAIILAVGALLVTVIIAVAFAMGRINGESATTIILGCVGGSAIAGVCAKVVKGKK
jgi:hypothetical protein